MAKNDDYISAKMYINGIKHQRSVLYDPATNRGYFSFWIKIVEEGKLVDKMKTVSGIVKVVRGKLTFIPSIHSKNYEFFLAYQSSKSSTSSVKETEALHAVLSCIVMETTRAVHSH